jgi:hypothetical protein
MIVWFVDVCIYESGLCAMVVFGKRCFCNDGSGNIWRLNEKTCDGWGEVNKNFGVGINK